MNVDLFFCGDSVTNGIELEPWGREEKRFSTLVAKKKNLSHHNISLSGACNDWIVKRIVNFFREGNTCKTAIIQFSAPERWNYYDPKEKRFQNVGNAKTTNNFRTKKMATAHSAYYRCIYTHELAIENYWKNVFFLDQYLKDKCKTIYLTLGWPVEKNSWAPDVEIGSVKLLIGNSRLVGHPSPRGHQRIADYIISRL